MNQQLRLLEQALGSALFERALLRAKTIGGDNPSVLLIITCAIGITDRETAVSLSRLR